MTTTNNIPHGYKESALGIIPSDWEVIEFEHIAQKSKGKYVPCAEEHKSCIELEHIIPNDGNILGFVDSSLQKVLFQKVTFYLVSCVPI